MVCPRCGFSLEKDSSGQCPKCGMAYARKTSVVMKTSAVLIAAGGDHQVYRSVSEVPASLRKLLEESTNSVNSATILIADRRGKEEIARALERVSEVSPAAPAELPAARVLGLSLRNWVGVAIGFASGVIGWLICAHHW
jgi:hypothetical protein